MLTEADYRLLLIEKAPPGMEPVVRALKKKANIDNPYAVAWSMYNEAGDLVCARCGSAMNQDDVIANKPCETCESMPMSSASAAMRGKVSASYQADRREARQSFRETARVLESIPLADAAAKAPSAPPEGPIVKVVLLTEGLGNLHDKNYYGPEAVASMPALFEGAVCMVDHPSYSEEKDIPEGRVQKTVGYYKGLHVETIQTTEGPKSACVGQLHFDISPEGWGAYYKACTAIHYAQEFPGSSREYVGLSINAYGDSEPRTMEVNGEEMDVNYVKQFVEVRSCDMVTIPARGGKFVALVESIAGAGGKNKEVRTMIVESLKKARKAFAEAANEKDADLRQKKMTEAQKVLDSLEAELVKVSVVKAGEGKKKEDGDYDDGDADDVAKKKKAADEAKKKEDEAAAKKKAEDEAEAERKTKAAKHGKEDEDMESQREAHGLAVKSLIKESGLAEEHFDMAELNAMSFAEAKREVARTKRVSEANAAALLKRLEPDLAAGHLPKLHESVGGKVTDNSDLFAPAN